MNCKTDYLEYREEYPEPIWSMFISETDYHNPIRDAQITDDYTGYITELQNCGQAADAPGTKELIDITTGDPYSTRLRPVTNLSEIFKSQKVMLASVQFYAYDPTDENAAPPQDAATLAAIYASRTSNEMFAQQYILNGFIQNWQPNFCRPSLKVNQKEIFKGFNSSNFGRNVNKGDLSIGIPLGYCFELYRKLGKVHDVEMFGQLAQYITGPKKFQRYVLMSIIEWWVGKSNAAE